MFNKMVIQKIIFSHCQYLFVYQTYKEKTSFKPQKAWEISDIIMGDNSALQHVRGHCTIRRTSP